MKSEAKTMERLQYTINSDSERDSDIENDRDISTQTVEAEVHRQDHGEPPVRHHSPPEAKTLEDFLLPKEEKGMPPVEAKIIPANQTWDKPTP